MSIFNLDYLVFTARKSKNRPIIIYPNNLLILHLILYSLVKYILK